MGKMNSAVTKSKPAKKTLKDLKSNPEENKAPVDKIPAKAIVRLTVAHGVINPGNYEIDGYNVDGDPILKTEHGCINVPLDKIEVVKSAAPTKTPAKDKQQTFIKEPDFYIDPHGQMTINKIDTPLGKLAQRMIRADIEIRKITSELEEKVEKILQDKAEDEDVMMEEMLKSGIKHIDVLEKRIVYKAGKKTNDQLIIKDLE